LLKERIMAQTQINDGRLRAQSDANRPPSTRPSGMRASSSQVMSGSESRVQQLLDRFARALTAGDGEAAAEVWATPAFVIGAGMTRPVATRDEVVAFFSGGKAQYNALGIVDTRAEILRLDWVSPDLVVVDVRWPYLRANGEEAGEERSTYTLLEDADGELKIRCVLMRGART
jgi:hypothetical protein